MQPTGIRVSWQLRHYVVHNLLVYSFTVQSLPFLPIYNCLSPPWTIPCFCTNPSVPTCLFPPVWWCLPPVVGQHHGLHPTPLTYPTHLQDTSGKYLNCATSIDHVGCLVGKLCRHAYMVSLCISDHFMSCQFSCLYISPFLLHHQVLHLTSSSLTAPSVDIPGPSCWTPPMFAGRRHECQWREVGTSPPQRNRGTQNMYTKCLECCKLRCLTSPLHHCCSVCYIILSSIR